jgi:hypothetical protein
MLSRFEAGGWKGGALAPPPERLSPLSVSRPAPSRRRGTVRAARGGDNCGSLEAAGLKPRPCGPGEKSRLAGRHLERRRRRSTPYCHQSSSPPRRGVGGAELKCAGQPPPVSPLPRREIILMCGGGPKALEVFAVNRQSPIENHLFLPSSDKRRLQKLFARNKEA